MSDEKQSPSPVSGDGQTGIVPPETEQKVREDLQSAADSAREAAERVKQEAQEQLGVLKQQAQEQLGEAKSFAAEQKDLAADRLESIADAVERVSEEMAGNNEAAVSNYARQAAGGIRQIADAVKQRDIDDIVGMAQDFGRRQPVAFLGAAALAGFIASRLVMSSAHRRSERQSSNLGNTYSSRMDEPPMDPWSSNPADTTSPNLRPGGAL
ncbi:MAG: hypothetical protein JWN11_2261 [Hyphomicrobiales bacterium]|nr:hypothetical protein [Hyphomicrobiales bacterium]